MVTGSNFIPESQFPKYKFPSSLGAQTTAGGFPAIINETTKE